ncbi:MAG TPA: hypothetical protein VGH03_17415 [Caulobacteraceae bacterium]
MLNQFVRRIAASLVGAVLVAVACGVAAVSAAYAIYAVLRLSLSAAAAAAIDAGVFALIAALIALILPRLVRGPRRKPVQRVDSDTARLATDAAIAVLTAITDMARGGRRRESNAQTSDRPARRRR